MELIHNVLFMRMDRFVTNFKYSGNFMRAQANAERVDDFGLRVAQ
ncbi:hypothetical protein NUKP55_33680 [Klebsiella variicola]|nr:hypothetical protein NUKP42_15050 [Klebsiella variicola]GKL37510.1 hypothetical protein NUKP55_33680 [Klebsiella variicola]GKN47950.1 hypothetical protein NUKP84_38700 [Klebsiella variicola]